MWSISLTLQLLGKDLPDNMIKNTGVIEVEIKECACKYCDSY